jgi:hypothetical protein
LVRFQLTWYGYTQALAAICTPLAARPRLLLTSDRPGEGVGHLAPALLHALEVQYSTHPPHPNS